MSRRDPRLIQVVHDYPLTVVLFALTMVLSLLLALAEAGLR